MMKNLSMRVKITLWFTIALSVAALFTYAAVLSVSNQILQKTIRDNLIETVENNYNEIRYYSSLESADTDKDANRYLEFEGGYLEVNSDFMHEINEVYTALYSPNGALLYGENPVSRQTAGVEFSDSRVQKIKVSGVTFYIFDRRLTTEGLDGLWMRGVVSETQGASQMSTITRISLIVLPAIVLIALAGGLIIVDKTLKPIKMISETAKEIGRNNDLKKRIELGEGKDELHRLADTFNDTFDKLDKAFEAEKRFISDASHELRTPVTVIAAQCEFSLESKKSAEEYENALVVIRRQSEKMSKLINNMLDFTRLEVGTEKYSKETVDMTELVLSLCSDMALIKENGITLECNAQNGVEFTGNHGLLTRMLTNLISNAYRYGKADGHIFVTLKKENRQITLSVADDGIGIAEEEREKIFERFYQADKSHSGAGIGLGLSMANEIARFHGGKITVESEEGKGSVFTVILPL